MKAQVYPKWELCLADDASSEGHVRQMLEHAARVDARIKFVVRPQNGHIAEGGTHAELLKTRGHYYRLYTQQFRHQLEVQYGVAEEDIVDEPESIEESVAAD